MAVQDCHIAETNRHTIQYPLRFKKTETDVSVISKDLLIKFDNPSPQGIYRGLADYKNRQVGFGKLAQVAVWFWGVLFQSKSQNAISCQQKIFKMKAQAVSKAGIKIERFMEENRKIRNQVKKLISIFQS